MEANHSCPAVTRVVSSVVFVDEVSMVQVEEDTHPTFVAKAHFPVARSTRTALPDPEVVEILAVAEVESCGSQRKR